MAAAPEFEVSHGHSVGYSWHIPKDSPNGSKVVYLRFPGGNPGAGIGGPAELWHASPTGANRTNIIGVGLATNHTGALHQWIDNENIIYFRRGSIDESTWFPRVVDLNGNIQQAFSAHPGVMPIHFNEATGKVVGGLRGDPTTTSGPLSDVSIIDPFTGNVDQILDVSAFAPWKNDFAGSDNP